MRNILRVLNTMKLPVALAILLMVASNLVSLILPEFMADIINQGIAAKDISYIWSRGIQMTVISLASMCIALCSSYFSAKVSTSFGRDVRRWLFHKTESLNQCDVDKIGTPSMITRCTNDIGQIQNMLLNFLRTIITAPIMAIGGTFMAFLTNWRLAMVIVFLVPLIALGAFIVSKTIVPMFRNIQKRNDAINRILREKLSGIRVIRAFNRSDFEDKRFSDANYALTSLSLRVQRIMAFLMPLASMGGSLLLLLLFIIESKYIGSLDPVKDGLVLDNVIGDMTKFIIYITMVVGAVLQAVDMFFEVPRAMVSAKRINEVLLMEPAIPEPEVSAIAQLPAAQQEPERGHLVFEQVSFAYPQTMEPLLQNISFEMHAGETTAIIGGTGSGKSTLVNLIPRFYDVTQGRITLNGVDIREMYTSELHQKIGFIPQKAFLFSGTVFDNMRFGREDATQEEIWEALEIAQAADFVRKLPNGLYDMISQSGKNLSGGQKQRLAIARAIVRKSEVFVFDDSFSALDYTTDAKLRQALKNAVFNAAFIVVAQRIGTIMQADRILVLDNGRLVGHGRHQELLENCPTYREIALSQLPEEELAI